MRSSESGLKLAEQRVRYVTTNLDLQIVSVTCCCNKWCSTSQQGEYKEREGGGALGTTLWVHSPVTIQIREIHRSERACL